MGPMFRPTTTDEQKAAARELLATRHAFIENSLGDKPFLTGDNFTVADAYLYVTLSWRERVGVDISRFPKLDCLLRTRARAAFGAEGAHRGRAAALGRRTRIWDAVRRLVESRSQQGVLR